MNDTFAIVAVTGINNDVMDAGLAHIAESVDKEIMIERYLERKYGLHLSNDDFEHIFDIINN